jgi:hypothetical protein
VCGAFADPKFLKDHIEKLNPGWRLDVEGPSRQNMRDDEVGAGPVKPGPWYPEKPEGFGPWIERKPNDFHPAGDVQVFALSQDCRHNQETGARGNGCIFHWDPQEPGGNYICAYCVNTPINDDDWIEWNGGARPVGPDVMVEIKARSTGMVYTDKALNWAWGLNEGGVSYIIKYRVVK